MPESVDFNSVLGDLVDDVIDEADSRNLQLEMHHRTMNGHLTVAKSRILGVDGDAISIAEPQAIGKTCNFPTGRVVEVFMNFKGKTFAFKSKIVRTRHIIQLNKQQRVRGMLISRPKSITERQKRSIYRVSLAMHSPPLLVHMHEVMSDTVLAAPIDAKQHKAIAVNASEEGLGLRIEGVTYTRFKIGSTYCLRFRTPNHADEFTLYGEVRHTRPILDGEAAVMGFMFLPIPDRQAMQRKLQPFAQFLHGVQRASIQRGKGAA